MEPVYKKLRLPEAVLLLGVRETTGDSLIRDFIAQHKWSVRKDILL